MTSVQICGSADVSAAMAEKNSKNSKNLVGLALISDRGIVTKSSGEDFLN